MNEKPTDEKLAEWQALCEKATPGPWDDASKYPEIPTVRIFSKSHYISSVGNSDDSREETESNAAFIAAARTIVPTLLAEVRELKAKLEATEFARDMADGRVRALERALSQIQVGVQQCREEGETDLRSILSIIKSERAQADSSMKEST